MVFYCKLKQKKTDDRTYTKFVTLASGLRVDARFVCDEETLTITLCIERNNPALPPCTATPSTFRVSPVSFCIVTGSLGDFGWGEIANWNNHEVQLLIVSLQRKSLAT